MNSTRKPNAMLIELVIVILFFAISAGIILQLFVAASDRSGQSATDSTALLMTEDVAEQFIASKLPVDAFFADLGWEQTNDTAFASAYTGEDSRPLSFTASLSADETEAGSLDALTLTVYDGDRRIVSLPVSRYLPKEVTP